jgi:hypothetical protein
MYIGFHVKYPLFLSDFNETWIFSTDFWIILKVSNFVRIRQVGAGTFHAVGQTDMTKLIVVFRSSANAPKNYLAITRTVQYTKSFTVKTFYKANVDISITLAELDIHRLFFIYYYYY